ncbi:putative MFS sugar transporter protein [Umbelopsis sp. PMI_123]|nr:putative MFS sugar transporter protein [Umbelopsis sp. PMI_123]
MADEKVDISKEISNPEDVAAVEAITDEELEKLSRQAITFWSKATFRIALILFVQGCNQAGYGVDWGVIGGVNSINQFHEYFGFGNAGTTIGIINALMTIGNIAGAPFLSLGDVIGRRGINVVGNAIVIMASLIQAFAPNLSGLMAGRFFMGFGSALMSNPQYMAEVSPTHWRGRIVGIFGACFQVGSILMTCVLLGTNTIQSNWAWRLPFLLQMIFPLVVVVFSYLITPESPRYLILKGRVDEARAVVAKYHTSSGDVNEPIVEVVIQQMIRSVKDEHVGFKTLWDFRPFVRKNGGRYRLLLLTLYSIFQQWNGGGIVSYYISPILETLGITSSEQQLEINLGLVLVYFVFTMVGSFIVDLVRRRTLIFAGLISFIILQTASAITSWKYTETNSYGLACLGIFWIFAFQTCSSTLIATMHNLYPVELISLPLRARGMGLYGLIQGIAGVIQTYGISIGIEKLGYKIYVVFIIYNCVQLALSYFLFPETGGLSLEEIDIIFETPGVSPMKMGEKVEKAKKERKEGIQA